MGVFGLQTFLRKGAPNEYCREVDVKQLAAAYRDETGRDPVMLVDGCNCLRSACLCCCKTGELLLGGQMQEFIKKMKDFVAAFQNIGVRVVFYFDGMTPESQRVKWKQRAEQKVQNVIEIFKNLDKNSGVQPEHLEGTLPSLVAATGSFVAKYVCDCDVHISVSDCDVEMAHFARKEDCFAILSQDTDFVILQGARHLLTDQELNLETMITRAYSREGLLKNLGLEPQQLCLLASLLGNDIVPVSKLVHFHNRLKQAHKGRELLHVIVDYIKEQNFSTSCDDEGLRKIAKDVFGDQSMAHDLATSLQNYLSPSTDVQEGTTVADTKDDNWQLILKLAEKRHRSCQVTTYLYSVISRNVYEMSGSLEDYSKDDMPVAQIYRPLRQRIYGVLLHEKPTVTAVEEWCVESRTVPSQPTNVPVSRMCSIEKIHPGLLKLWDDKCEPDIRWRLFVESLTQDKKLDAKALQNLGLPYVVPVAVLFYLRNWEKPISETDVEAILAQAALVKLRSPEELQAIPFQRIHPEALHLSTVFTRGVTTVLLLLSACGFDIEKAMPWHYFDGKLFQQKYIQRTRTSVRRAQLCDDKLHSRANALLLTASLKMELKRRHTKFRRQGIAQNTTFRTQ